MIVCVFKFFQCGIYLSGFLYDFSNCNHIVRDLLIIQIRSWGDYPTIQPRIWLL